MLNIEIQKWEKHFFNKIQQFSIILQLINYPSMNKLDKTLGHVVKKIVRIINLINNQVVAT
jgi:hypothetical protein